jgi:hypothetical protein
MSPYAAGMRRLCQRDRDKVATKLKLAAARLENIARQAIFSEGTTDIGRCGQPYPADRFGRICVHASKPLLPNGDHNHCAHGHAGVVHLSLRSQAVGLSLAWYLVDGTRGAGQLPPFLNGNEMILGPSLPLGIDPAAEYEDHDFTLDCGDRLMLHTDGVLEARSAKGELYGFGRLTILLAGVPDAKSIVDAALAFGQEDDITVLTIERLHVHEAAHSVAVNLSVGLAPA